MKYMNDSLVGDSGTDFKFHIYWGNGEKPRARCGLDNIVKNLS